MQFLPLMLAFVGGLALGGLYFGGLWFTTVRIAKVQWPEVWLVMSFAVRMAVVIAGFYIVMAGRWERAVACLVGLLIARTILTWKLRPSAKTAWTRRE